MTALLFLVVLPAFGQTYDLATGKTMTIINDLPDTIKNYFSHESLVKRFSNQKPVTDYVVKVFFSEDQIYIGIQLSDFNPDLFPEFRPKKYGNYFLYLMDISKYMIYLSWWYGSIIGDSSIPAEMRITLSQLRPQYYCIVQKGDEKLMFFAQQSQSGDFSI